MDMARTLLALREGTRVTHVDATRIRFSAHQCIAYDGSPSELRCLRRLADYLAPLPGLALAIDRDTRLLHYLLQHAPSLRERVRSVVVEHVPADGGSEWAGMPVVLAAELTADIQNIFLCETRACPRMRMRCWLGDQARLIDLDLLPELSLEDLPARAWVPCSRDTIYPIDLPDIDFHPGMDVIVIDCPARNLGLMPNGLGYVHNALKQVNVKYQTCDLDILLYHRFHIRRLFDEGGKICISAKSVEGKITAHRELPADPWQAEHYDLWSDAEVIASFEPEIEEIVDKLVAARPKVLGLSIHACNEKFSATVVERVKAALPETVVLVGGFSCYSPDIGLRGFPQADYMCIGEADLTVGPLVERLARGERPANTPGVLSRYDRPEVPFLPAPMVHELDLLEHPRYEWCDLSLYRNYNAYQLTPVIASRGCRWSRCTFCAERFYWRIRSPESFVDELEWLVGQGCRLFMFNESDLNGRPETVLAICDEIIRRGLQVKLTGQLRIHKKSDQAFFRKLRQAGFVALRFGVDAFSENTLRLQKKGYTTATLSQNLKDCWEAGIYTEVNWVIGVPGETDQDIEEGIELILRNKPYIGRLANINPLILTTGSVYWLEPQQHNIHFRGDRETLYRDHPRALPAHTWYSTDPYIDEKVRKRRFEHIVLALHEAQFDVGAWADRVIEDVKLNRDRVRSGPSEDAEHESLSAGVGRMEKPTPPPEGELEFNADARSSAYVFRAGSALPEDKTYYFQTDLFVVAGQNELFGIERSAFESAFGRRVADDTAGSRRAAHLEKRDANGGHATIDVRARFQVQFARTRAVVPELVQSVGRYNVVYFDSLYYGVPQAPDPSWPALIAAQLRDNGFQSPAREASRGISERLWSAAKWGRRKARGLAKRILILVGLRKPVPSLPPAPPAPCPILWGEIDPGRLPGVVAGRHLVPVIDEVEQIQGSARAPIHEARPARGLPAADARPSLIALRMLETPAAAQPRLVGSLEGYNIVEYEGWFYGLPQNLGDIHLEKVDVVEMPGVLRDLSKEVVEGEIREQALVAGK
jgi:hypothetical protein